MNHNNTDIKASPKADKGEAKQRVTTNEEKVNEEIEREEREKNTKSTIIENELTEQELLSVR